MLYAQNPMLKGKYEINVSLPLGEGSWFRVRERDSSVAQLNLDSSGPGVEDSDDTLLTHHTFFVFFGGDEVSEALAGVFLIFVFPP
jgi:hypothetical protein